MTEVLDRDQAIRLFDLDGVGRGAERMDYAKLTNLNGIYIRQADDDRLTARCSSGWRTGRSRARQQGGARASGR